jgi:hypothetical protein
MRSIFLCVLSLAITGSVFFVGGQEKNANQMNDPIEINEDRFSGVTTVKLKPQAILDKEDHQITMEIETKLGGKGLDKDDMESVKAVVRFESQTKSSPDFGDQELHFLIDGKPLSFGRENIRVNPYANKDLKPGFKISRLFSEIFDRNNVEQFSKASRVEMRIGSVEFTFGEPVVAILREYCSKVLAKHKIVKERKP